MQKRLFVNRIILLLSTLSAIIGLSFLFWILGTLFYKGLSTMDFSIFAKDLVEGGIRNLLVGQFVMALIATAIAVPLGMIAGIYLREYNSNGKIAFIVRSLSDIMMSAPSIVIGVFVYAIYINQVNHFAGWGGVMALVIMMLPIIVSTTDNMLSLVPKELREAGIALGGNKHTIIFQIVVKAAKAGLMTGVLLAFARIVGETAPLLFTSANSQFFTMDLSDQFPSLTVSIYNLATYPDQASRDLAWAASFVLTMVVLIINLGGRYMTRNKNKG